jgi:hypothetical protein
VADGLREGIEVQNRLLGDDGVVEGNVALDGPADQVARTFSRLTAWRISG